MKIPRDFWRCEGDFRLDYCCGNDRRQNDRRQNVLLQRLHCSQLKMLDVPSAAIKVYLERESQEVQV